ncbi:hypothetical protein BDFB_014510, partial [Asbolus verrucosus]
MAKNVKDLVSKDGRLKLSSIAKEVETSEASVLRILHLNLGLNKVSS